MHRDVLRNAALLPEPSEAIVARLAAALDVIGADEGA
jgi:hypothetical protein